MKPTLTTWVIAVVALTAVVSGEGIDIGGQVKLDVSEAGAVTQVTAGGKAIGTGQAGGFSVVEILPPDG